MKSYNPEMHTAEHVLNRTMVSMFGCDRSFSNHLEKKKSKCDYRFDRALTAEEEQAIEAKVNEILAQHVDVKGYDISREEAQANFKLDRLPEEAGEELRVVTVGDYDECLCIGEHVANTKEVGEFKLGSTSFEDGVLRIRFKLKRP
nr:hypothetical protein [uncultured Carboxylicivirga sp.]